MAPVAIQEEREHMPIPSGAPASRAANHPPIVVLDTSRQALAHPPREHFDRDGTRGTAEIDSVLARAFDMSEQQVEVEPSLMLELRKYNKRFLTEHQAKQLWIVEQRNHFLAGGRELADELRQADAFQKVVPALEDVRRTAASVEVREQMKKRKKAAVKDGREGKKEMKRVNHYRSALHSLDQCVFAEIDSQTAGLLNVFQKVRLGLDESLGPLQGHQDSLEHMRTMKEKPGVREDEQAVDGSRRLSASRKESAFKKRASMKAPKTTGAAPITAK